MARKKVPDEPDDEGDAPLAGSKDELLVALAGKEYLDAIRRVVRRSRAARGLERDLHQDILRTVAERPVILDGITKRGLLSWVIQFVWHWLGNLYQKQLRGHCETLEPLETLETGQPLRRAPVSAPEDDLDRREWIERLHWAIGISLCKMEAEMYRRRHFEGWQAIDLARWLGVSESTVYRRLDAATEKVVKALVSRSDGRDRLRP